MKRHAYVQNGRPFIARSVAIHSPFAARFFKRAPVVQIEWGNFLLTPTVHTHRTTIITLAVHARQGLITQEAVKEQ